MIRVVETLAAQEEAPNRLSVSVVVAEGERRAAEFIRVKDALLEWQRSGRAARGALDIDIHTEESLSSVTLNEFMNVVSERDAQISEFYRDLKEAIICMVSPSGKRIKKIGFAH